MEMTVLKIIDEATFLLPLLETALSEGNVTLGLNLFSRINPWLLDISMLINAPDYSKVDVVLRGLIETGAVTNQCLLEIDGFRCEQDQLSAIRSIRDTLKEIRPIVISSPVDTLSQNLETFFTSENGYSTRIRVMIFYSVCVAVAVAAGLVISIDLPQEVILGANQ